MEEHWRNKFYYGGRAGGKSYAFADSLLLMGRQKKLFIVCLREIQGSIKDSVYKLLCDRISFYGLEEYRLYEDSIENLVTGTVFVFKGLRDQDPQKIKSLEGADIAWVEEAQTITKKSWDILEPTIRKAGSEIWISMNREEENDPLWMAIANKPDAKTLVRRVNYYDNPFCPEEMIFLADKCKRENIDDYEHIWLGAPIAQGNKKLISSKAVWKAFEPKMDQSSSPLVIGADIARFGDDTTSICFRKGRYCIKFDVYKKIDIVGVANILTNIIKEYRPAKVFIDIGGLGAGVYDILIDRGFTGIVRGVNFGERAINEERYFNRRCEMWDGINLWLNGNVPVQLPNDEGLFNDLTAVNKKYDKRGRLQLEEKAEIKKRLGHSTDKGDALALTFAEPVYDTGQSKMYGNGNVPIEEMFKDIRNSKGDSSW